MTRTLMVLAAAFLTVSAFLQAEHREFVTRGEVLSVSVEDGTLTMREIAEPPENSRPGTMQSGVVRSFTVTANTDVMTAQGQSIELGQIRPRSPGDHPLRARFGQERGEGDLGDVVGN